MSERKIVTHFDYPPIPIRSMDWSATFDDYEAWTEDGEWVTTHPIGRGPTEAAAVADLLAQADD